MANELKEEPDVIMSDESRPAVSFDLPDPVPPGVSFDLPEEVEAEKAEAKEMEDISSAMPKPSTAVALVSDDTVMSSAAAGDWRSQLTKAKLVEHYIAERSELNFYHCHFKSMPDLSAFSRPLARLILRQNLMVSTKGLRLIPECESLQHLDLYLNCLASISRDFECLSGLQWLDLSFNAIRVLKHLENCTSLTHLYLANNKLRKIEGLQSLCKLQMLELGANRIRVMEGLDSLCELKELWIGKNKITAINGLAAMRSLKLLSIQSNRLTSIGSALTCVCGTLQQLYLANNGLTEIDEGFSALSALRFLDIGANQIKRIDNLHTLHKLEELWLNDNLIEVWDNVNTRGIPSKRLLTVYLERNPIQGDTDAARFEYRRKLAGLFPTLRQIDAEKVRDRDRADVLERSLYSADDSLASAAQS